MLDLSLRGSKVEDTACCFFGGVRLMSTAKQCKQIIEACDIYAKHIAVCKVYSKAPILACHLKDIIHA